MKRRMDTWKTELEKAWIPRRRGDYDTRPAIPGAREKLLDAIAEMAFGNLAVYGNCCRSTLWAIQTHLRCEESGTLRAAAVLAGGIGGTGQTCGAVLGGLIALGQVLAPDDFRDLVAYRVANACAKRLVERLRAQYGSTNCYEIQESLMGFRCDEPSKAQRWQEQGGPSACAAVCAVTARFAAELILDASEAQSSA